MKWTHYDKEKQQMQLLGYYANVLLLECIKVNMTVYYINNNQ